MLIKPAKFKKVKKMVSERISDDVYGCDECKKVIDFNKKDVEYLEITVFNNDLDRDASRHQLCSWECVFNYLPKVESDYFVSLPYLNYDKEGETSADAFFKALKRS